jgi:oligopeptide transport system substrate-binding protein
MLKSVPWGHRRGLPLFIILLLSLSLACGLTQGLNFNRDDSTPVIELDGGGSSSDDGDAAIIEEPAPDEDTSSNEQAPEPSAEIETAENETIEEEAESDAGGSEPQPQIELAEDQIFILPGGSPPTLDPHLSGDATSAGYVVEIYSGLLAYDLDLSLVPDIAESYEISDDGLVYTFKIREEAVFHDGKPIRAQDFKWSFERACDPATGSHTADTYLGDIVGCRAKLQNETDEVVGVEVVDDLTLQLTIDEPKGFFLAKMTYPTAYVLDRENVENDPAWFLEPNGSGPFILAEFAPEEGAIILNKNDNFYHEPGPILERVIYLVDAPVNAMTGYQEGLESLGLPADITYDAIPIGISQLSGATDPNNPLSEEFVSTPELNVSYVGFNVNKPPFDDPKVRQAFNLALDKRRMVKLVFQDTFPVANGIVPPTMPGYQNPDLSDYEFDPERALALIADSSYGDVSELPDITLNTSGTGGSAGPIVEAIVESYQANLGLEIAVEQSPWPEFLAGLNQPDPPFQIYMLGWIADYPDPQNFLEVLFHTESTQNHGNYSNPAVDTLLDKARGAQDVEERTMLYQQAEQMILDDGAWIPLYFGVENWVVKPYVQNFQIPPIIIPKFQYMSIAEH